MPGYSQVKIEGLDRDATVNENRETLEKIRIYAEQKSKTNVNMRPMLWIFELSAPIPEKWEQICKAHHSSDITYFLGKSKIGIKGSMPGLGTLSEAKERLSRFIDKINEEYAAESHKDDALRKMIDDEASQAGLE